MQDQYSNAPANTRLYAWGSAEFDQYDTGNDEFERRKPILIPFFPSNKISIHKITCGAQHSLALSTQGKVYSWGSPDEGALGRAKGKGGKYPALVDLPHNVDMISCGDSHSVAVNSLNGLVYTWGVYRNVISGNMAEIIYTPTQTGEIAFKNRKIQKLLSGTNHTMILSDGKVFAWGDPDTCVLGRMPLKRRKYKQALSVGALPYRKVQNIFTGGNHCFLVNQRYSRKQ